jgi:glucarate dehydratase
MEATFGTIAAIRATPVNVPLAAPYRWSAGAWTGISKTIVEVVSSDGVVGIGEAPSYRAAPLIDAAIAPRLLGADAGNVADCERRAVPPITVLANAEDAAVVHAWGGIEMALWDLIGKRLGVSLATLLGGRVRDHVGFTEYFAPRLAHEGRGGESDPIAVAAYCARMAEAHGSTQFEGKVGVFDLATDLKLVHEVRAAIGDDALLRLDANKRWDLVTARRALARLARYDVASIEDPTRTLAELARLRETTAIAFSTHDVDLALAARAGVPDAFVINLSVLGGLRRTLAVINACGELGVSVWFHSPDTGVMNAAYLQVAAAVETLAQPSQTLLRWHTDDVIAGGPFRPERNLVAVPDGPGLAVELDQEALARCHRRFLDEGPYALYEDAQRPGRYSRLH